MNHSLTEAYDIQEQLTKYRVYKMLNLLFSFIYYFVFKITLPDFKLLFYLQNCSIRVEVLQQIWSVINESN